MLTPKEKKALKNEYKQTQKVLERHDEYMRSKQERITKERERAFNRSETLSGILIYGAIAVIVIVIVLSLLGIIE